MTTDRRRLLAIAAAGAGSGIPKHAIAAPATAAVAPSGVSMELDVHAVGEARAGLDRCALASMLKHTAEPPSWRRGVRSSHGPPPAEAPNVMLSMVLRPTQQAR
jgi:hypothetical protein